MRRAVFDSKFAESERHRFTGLRAALTSSGSFRFLKGHYPYGVHRVYRIQNPRYFVMLRDPVERAISHYHFIRACESSSYVHPSIGETRKCGLAEFYQKFDYQNMQTRFVAGLGWRYAGRYISLNGRLGRWALSRAKRNLVERYEAFGLKERFHDSARLFAARLGASVDVPSEQYRKTPDRPDTSEVSDVTLRKVVQRNILDVSLYWFAIDHFDSQ